MRELTYKAAVSLVNGLATVYGDLPDSIPFVKKKIPLWVILLSATGNLVTISEDVAKELALTTPLFFGLYKTDFRIEVMGMVKAEDVRSILDGIGVLRATINVQLVKVDRRQLSISDKALYVMAKDIEARLRAILDKWGD